MVVEQSAHCGDFFLGQFGVIVLHLRTYCHTALYGGSLAKFVKPTFEVFECADILTLPLLPPVISATRPFSDVSKMLSLVMAFLAMTQ